MSRRFSIIEEPKTSSSLSRSSSAASHLSRWSKGPATPPGSRRGSLDTAHSSSTEPNHPGEAGSFKGHLGHLTPEQEDKLSAFKAELKAKNIYEDRGSSDDSKHMGRGRVDDTTLLRFLRARKFDVPGGFKQYAAYVAWREETNVDSEYEQFDVEQFEELRRVYPMWTGRRDLRGIPIYVYKISHLTPSTLSRLIPSDEASLSTIATISIGMQKFLFPFLNSPGIPTEHPETPISGTNSIIDVSGVGLSRFWGLRSHLQVASQVASANFPETIDRIFVYGAPSFFPTVFNWAKKWFDKGTVEKIFILDSDPLPTLLSMMPSSSIPKEYGGTLDWTYGDDPALEPAIETCFGSEGYVRGPLIWDSDAQALRKVGTVAGKRRDEGSPAFVPPPSSSERAAQQQIPIDGLPGQDEDYERGRKPSAMASEIPNGASSRDAHHLPNGTSPDSRPTPEPSHPVVIGTHTPVTHRDSALPGAKRTASPDSLPHEETAETEEQQKERAMRDQTRNRSIEKGWVPGSGVSEEDFLKGIGAVEIK